MTRTHDDSDIHHTSPIRGLLPEIQAPNHAKGAASAQCFMQHHNPEIKGKHKMDQLITMHDGSILQHAPLIRELQPAEQPPHLAKCEGF